MAITDWLAPLLTLTVMEIILGIDNIIFLAIIVGKLPADQQAKARRLGLSLALGMRVLLLLVLSTIMRLQDTSLFHLSNLPFIKESWFEGKEKMNSISWRDLILLAGGLFLIGKSTYEIHDKLEGAEEKPVLKAAGRFGLILVQICIVDLVFSVDSVITAVGMAQTLWIMIAAMIIAMGVMLVFAGPIGNFVHQHPTLKMLALSFLILIGVMLVAESMEQHIERGYIYFAMTFSVIVEILNMRLRAKAPPVHLHEPEPTVLVSPAARS